MNKNFLLAISLILLTLFFFNSPFYHEKILGQKSIPQQNLNKSNQEDQQTGNVANQNKNIGTIESIKNNERTTGFKEKNVQDSSQINEIIGDTLWIENEKYICGISEVGAKIVSLKMKDYFYAQNKENKDSIKNNLELLQQDEKGGANLAINGQSFDYKKFSTNSLEKKIKISKNETKTIEFSIKDVENNTIIKKFVFDGNTYKIGFNVLSDALDGKSVIVGWNGGISESEERLSLGNSKSASGVNEPHKVHTYDGKNVSHIQSKKTGKEEETGFYKWVAITSKYFMVAMVADTVKNADLLIESYNEKENDNKKPNNIINYSIQIRRTCEGSNEGYWIYAGPSKYSIISSYHEKFQKVLFGGWEWLIRADLWFPYVCEAILWLLIYLNGILKDYGMTIIVITIITRIITFPLSQSSMKSMSRMKDLQPKITHIRERYKTNPKKMNEEVMALYKQEGINPFNPGCLPMFLQMPILFALFIVLRKAIELRGAHTILIPWVKDLSQPEALISLTGILPNGIPMYGNNIALLPILMAILTFFQNKMTIKDPNQKMMIYFMPIFMLVLFNNFPAGLVLYWTFSNALGIIQQYLLDKSIKKNAPVVTAQIANIKGKSGKKK